MCDDIIVRVDYYPDGQIIPLGITYSSGESIYINRVLSVTKDLSSMTTTFRCKSKDEEFNLIYANFKWFKE